MSDLRARFQKIVHAKGTLRAAAEFAGIGKSAASDLYHGNREPRRGTVTAVEHALERFQADDPKSANE